MAHFDLEKVERQMRESIASVRAQADKAIADGIADEAFVKAQREFDEPRLQFLLAPMRAENNGLPRSLVLNAAAAQLGSLAGSLLNSATPEEQSDFMGWFERVLMDTMMGTIPEGEGAMSNNTFDSEEGGHA